MPNAATRGPASFVECDDELWGLGYVTYTCPACLRELDTDTRLWPKRNDVYDGHHLFFRCERCSAPLSLAYDFSPEGGLYVEVRDE